MEEPAKDTNVAARRILPALPAGDEEVGEIRWRRWEPALNISHLDPGCPTCAFPGPLSTAIGESWYTPPLSWARTERSSAGRASKWVRVQHRSYWVASHWAVRCPQCDETRVWRRSGWEEIAYYPPTTDRALPPADDVLF